MRTASTNDRDRALRRLRRSTSVVLAGAGALVVAFAGLAARALPGHHTAKIGPARVQTNSGVRPRGAGSDPASTPPPLVPAQSAATPTAPAAPPAQTPAPPVVVSGGT
jgi:hypothetical protein